MSVNERPTCVTVIGWFWIIIGGLMFLSAIGALFSSFMIKQMSQNHPQLNQEMPLIFRYLPILCIFQLAFASIGVVAGINFLKLKSRSRIILEILSWLFILFILGFGIYMESEFLSKSSPNAPQNFNMIGSIMGILILAIYGVPFGIVIKFLRGDRVKNALNGSTEPAT